MQLQKRGEERLQPSPKTKGVAHKHETRLPNDAISIFIIGQSVSSIISQISRVTPDPVPSNRSMEITTSVDFPSKSNHFQVALRLPAQLHHMRSIHGVKTNHEIETCGLRQDKLQSVNKCNQLCEIVRQYEDASVLTQQTTENGATKLPFNNICTYNVQPSNHISQESYRKQAHSCRPHTGSNIQGHKGQGIQVFWRRRGGNERGRGIEALGTENGALMDSSACTRSKANGVASGISLYSLARAVVPSAAQHHKYARPRLPAGFLCARVCEAVSRVQLYPVLLARQHHKRCMKFSGASWQLGQIRSSAKRTTNNPVFDHCPAQSKEGPD